MTEHRNDPPIADVYYAHLPHEETIGTVYPVEREREIAACRNARVKREKYHVWRLLEYALESSLGISMRDATPRKNDNKKWVSDACFFSLSHSGDVVAVAVSDAPIGVDVEGTERERYEMIADHIFSDAERAHYEALEENAKMRFVMQAWTQKESLFKRADECVFAPKSYDVLKADVQTHEICVDGRSYFLSVASENVQSLRIKNVTIH